MSVPLVRGDDGRWAWPFARTRGRPSCALDDVTRERRRMSIGATSERPRSAARTRSGVNGTSRSLTPVASKMALPIAGATTVIDVSPEPQASTSVWLSSTMSIAGGAKPSGERMVGAPVDRGDLPIVPRHLFAKRAAHALKRAAFDLVAHAVGVRDRSAVLRDDEPCDLDPAGVLVDGDVGDHRDVAVVALVADAGDASAGDLAGACATSGAAMAAVPSWQPSRRRERPR